MSSLLPSAPADDTICTHICDSSWYLLCRLSLAPWVAVSHALASPPATISSACVSFEVSPLPLPSFTRRSPPCCLLFICHLCPVVSILHATLNKQTLCPIAPSLRTLFFTCRLSTICHLRLNPSHPFFHLIIPCRLPLCLRPCYSSSPPAFELSYLEGFLLSALPLLTGCCPVSWTDMQLEVRACSVENIKSEAKPDRICLSQCHHLPRCCGLHWLTSPCPLQPFDYVYNSSRTVGEQQLDFDVSVLNLNVPVTAVCLQL